MTSAGHYTELPVGLGYARWMVGKPAEPPPAGRSEIGWREEEGGHEQRGERVGSVAIARHVKDDGRALILYTHREREQA